MSKHKPEKIFEEIAQQSRLIKHINNIFNLSDIQEILRYQETVNKLNSKYCLSCMEGRLELISDLISAAKNTLKDCEITALNSFTEILDGMKDDNLTFLGFYIDNLVFTIKHPGVYNQQNSNTKLQQSSLFFRPHLQAYKLIMAITLSGAIVSGCNQENSSMQTGNAVIRTTLPAAQKAIESEKTSLPAPSAAISKNPAANPPEPFIYTVKKGDSIKSIASRFGSVCEIIVKNNNIKYDKERDWFVIHPGMKLTLHVTSQKEKSEKQIHKEVKTHSQIIPLELSSSTSNNAFTLHLIEKGDCLWQISKKYNVPEKKIIEYNNILNPDSIKYGNILKIPSGNKTASQETTSFKFMNSKKKVEFLKMRTIRRGHPYLKTIVEMAEQYSIDPRLYAALIWEESWFDKNARSKDNCRRLVQLDPRFHHISNDMKENFRKSLGYLRHEFIYYRKNGFDTKSATICALAAYNGGNTRVRNFIKNGKWNGKNIETMPLKETREHIIKVLRRCRTNYQAIL